MIKTKYWLSILAISVVLIAGSLAVSPIAIADDDDDDDDDDKIVITGTSGDEIIRLGDFGNFILCDRCIGLTVTGPVTGPFDAGFPVGTSERWIINPEAGDGVDDEYIINGNGGSDFFDFIGGSSPDNDELEIENFEHVRIFDGDGDDEYEIKGSSGDLVEYTDGPGDDELEFEG